MEKIFLVIFRRDVIDINRFRFGIIGAAKIANKFCDAVSRFDGVEVVAVSSKDMKRAGEFAEKTGFRFTMTAMKKCSNVRI